MRASGGPTASAAPRGARALAVIRPEGAAGPRSPTGTGRRATAGQGVGVPPVHLDPSPTVPASRHRVRAPRNLVGGLGLAAVALVALYTTRGLAIGTLRSMGPGALPRGVATLLLAAGVMLAVSSFLKDGPGLDRWRWRGPLCVSLAVVLFALTIRSVGLAVAGPLVVLVGGAASPEARPRELVVLATALTVLCVGLFRYALGLPIPVLVLPGVVTL